MLPASTPPPLPAQLPHHRSEIPGKRWPAFLMLFLCFPVGLLLLCLSKSFTPREKKVWSIVGLTLLILIFLVPSQSGEESKQSAATTTHFEASAASRGNPMPLEKGAPESYSNEPLPVEISAQAAGRGNQVVIEGKTNLPDGTPLVCKVRNLLSEWFIRVETNGGSFSIGPIPKDSATHHGSYLFEITSLREEAMPRVVRQRLGEKCENLSGEKVEVATMPGGESFKRVCLLSSFTVGKQQEGDESLGSELFRAGKAAEGALAEAERIHEELASFRGELENAQGAPGETDQKHSRELQQAAKSWSASVESLLKDFSHVDGFSEIGGEIGHPLNSLASSLELDSQTLGVLAGVPKVLRPHERSQLKGNHEERIKSLVAVKEAIKNRIDPKFNEKRMTNFR